MIRTGFLVSFKLGSDMETNPIIDTVDVSWSSVYERIDDVVTREIAGEVILVPVKGEIAALDNLFVLNPLGTYIWVQLNGKRDLSTVIDAVVNHFEVERTEAERDCREFVKELTEVRLVKRVV